MNRKVLPLEVKMIKELSYDDIADAIDSTRRSGKPIVIDFWAPWCGPCRVLTPIIDEISEEMDDKATFAKIDVEENREAALAYNVMSIPTLVIFKDGIETHRIIGSTSKRSLVSEFAEAIG